jgi:hypothetical protein
MPQQEEEKLPSELGISRRRLLRRGAIVAGSLVWVAPVIQSFRTPAFAASPVVSTCCKCHTGNICNADGLSCQGCQQFCANAGGVAQYKVGTGCACAQGSAGGCKPTGPGFTCLPQDCR